MKRNYSTGICFLQPACDILHPSIDQEVKEMTSAYILVEALPGKAIELTNIIKGIKGVKHVHLVTGPYDVITFAEAPDLKSLGDMIVKKIQSSGTVARTLTCITVEQ
jgi:DNA-binding Lrp family transcriptional regulator